MRGITSANNEARHVAAENGSEGKSEEKGEALRELPYQKRWDVVRCRDPGSFHQYCTWTADELGYWSLVSIDEICLGFKKLLVDLRRRVPKASIAPTHADPPMS